MTEKEFNRLATVAVAACLFGSVMTQILNWVFEAF